MALLDETERTEIVVEIEEYLSGGTDRQFGEFTCIPLKSIGGRVIQGALGEIMTGRYPYSNYQQQHETFGEIARALRDKEPYPLSRLDAGTSSEEKIIGVLTEIFARDRTDVSPASRLVQDLGIVEEAGARCLVSISYRCAIDITCIDFPDYFLVGKLNRLRNFFRLPVQGPLPKRTLTVGQLGSCCMQRRLEC